MTRKQALHKALEVLTDLEAIKKINELLEEMPLTCWSEAKIFDSIDQFVLDNGRNPTATDFIKNNMPPHTVIKLRFGMTLGEFLAEYYPQPEFNRDEQKQLFISEYNRIKPQGACDFNKRKTAEIPTWITFAKMFGIGKWLDWLNLCGLEKSSPTLVKRTQRATIIIVAHDDLSDKYNALSFKHPPS
ncbi:MAG: hypothetical protein FWD48_12335 [Oscillospiraceae bacterium]|nr:hypothetical protein [Oscillospiraceae bacterium]